MPIALLKVWSFLKSHWYIPVVLIVVLIGILTKQKALVDWSKFVKDSRDSHKQEVEAIERAHAEEIAAREAAFKRMELARAAIEAEYKKNQVEIDAQKQKEIDRLLKKTKDDPQAMASEIEQRLGFKVIVVE